MAELPPAAQRYMHSAQDARHRGDAPGERNAIDLALNVAPLHPQLLNARGMLALNDRDAVTAVTMFGRAVECDPAQPVLWINLATAHRLGGDDAGEQAALEKALGFDRRQPTPQLRLAELHERQGRDIEAARYWAAVVQLAEAMPNRPDALENALRRGQAFLARHADQVGGRIDAALASASLSPTADRRRVAAGIEYLLGKRRIYVNQCSGVHVPFLPADEFFDSSLFPWFAALEEHTAVIRAEAQALLATGGVSIRPYVRQEPGTPENLWSPLDHSEDWSACFLWEYGVRNDDVCARCPETAAALAAVPQNDSPGKAPTAFFSILRPHTHIPAHTGVTNSRSIVHLPLVVPDGCRFRVGGETREWVEGRAFAFDDTIEHEAWNDSDQLRIVLIFDVWNPHLTSDEQAMLKAVFQATGDRGVAS